MDISDLVHSVDSEIALVDYENSSSINYIEPYQFKILDKNNNIKWLEISTSNFKWNNKDAVLCFILDVTNKKEMEDALKERERRKNLLIKGMNNLIFILDYDFKFLDFYSSSDKFLLLKPEEFIGKYINEINFPHKVLKKILKALNNTKISGNDSQLEYSLDIHDQNTWFDVSITTIHDEVINKTEFLCIIKDITKLKESEREIKAERDLFSAGPVMTIVWSCYTHWTVKKISNNVEQILGYKPKELLDSSFKYSYIIHDDDNKKYLKS